MSREVRCFVPEFVGPRMQRLFAGSGRLRAGRHGCFALALLVLWLPLQAQHAHAEPGRLEIGAKLAPSMEKHLGDRATPATVNAYKTGISFGVGARYSLLDWFSAQAELLYATRGSDVDMAGDTIGTFNFTYLELPLLARVWYPLLPLGGDAVRPRLSVYALFGPSLSVLIGAEIVDGAGTNDLDEKTLHSLDVGVIGGLGVAWEVTPEWVVSLEARYDRGFTDAFPDMRESKNEAFLLTLGVDFTLRHGNQDGDLLADYRDPCPAEKEDKNKYQDGDGCPDAHLDADGDGIFAGDDKCPDEKEDDNKYENDDGCPDADHVDTDKDGILDVADKCPVEPFSHNKDALNDRRGCPPDELNYVTVKDGRIVGDPPLLFLPFKADIPLTTQAILDQVVTLLTIYYPDMRVRIEGHADGDATTSEKNPELANRKESEKRARAVMEYLIGKGIDPRRLEWHGFGGTKPASEDGSAEGRARNRRVEFLILEGGPTAGEGAKEKEDATR